MSRWTVRLSSISLANFKNVQKGTIDMRRPAACSADILALYGQNGSGKTSLIDAMGVLKRCLVGDRLPQRAQTFIEYGCSSATVEYAFRITDGSKVYRTVYEVVLTRRSASTETESPESQKLLPVYISREVLKIAAEEQESFGRLRRVIDTGQGDAFGPDTMLRQLVGVRKEPLLDLIVEKRMAIKESRSFIFSQEFRIE